MDAELRAAERAGDGQRLKVALQRAGRWPEPLPAEVVEAIEWRFGKRHRDRFPGYWSDRFLDHENVRYFEKEHFSQPLSWVRTLRSKHPYPKTPNPWRKCHSETYWIYVNIDNVRAPVGSRDGR